MRTPRGLVVGEVLMTGRHYTSPERATRSICGEDVLEKRADGRYGFVDPAFAIWLKYRVDFRLAMPPLLVGTQSEQVVARRLAADGFRGVYHSRASRGA